MRNPPGTRHVLFIHPRKGSPDVAMPHLGIASLSALLQQAGHQVTVLDEVLFEPGEAPSLEAVLAEARPDVIGVSAYTSTLDRTKELMARARTLSAAPILVGGPHAALWPEDLVATGLADYVVRGEAEEVIVRLVEEAERRDEPLTVDCPVPDPRALPWPDYSSALNADTLTMYPVMTSRGCPYSCSFCAVHRLSSRKWRSRDPEDCAREVAAAKERWPALGMVNVSDDCPTADPKHFKAFLRCLVERQLDLRILVDNMRADKVDEELVVLLKAAGVRSLSLGVEHGDPEVFALVGKRETHDDIRRAAALIRKHGLDLGLCFVIGLPGDTFRRTEASIRFAQDLKPDYLFWNVAHPFPGTEMHRWFQEQGAALDPPRAYTSYDNHWLQCAEPTVETPEFTKWERKRAYFWAAVETDQYVLDRAALLMLLSGAWHYRLPGPALRALCRRTFYGGIRRLKRRLTALLSARLQPRTPGGNP
jgi:radical SAM superfamily enzyme YgiQ (UPF0313 family)